jgi:predicted dehydrogenase
MLEYALSCDHGQDIVEELAMFDVQDRREFLKAAFKASATVPAMGWFATKPGRADTPRRANEKLNLAVIGVGGRGADNLEGVASENIVVLCDIDAARLAAAAARFPHAAKYDDYRRVFDHKELDGVVVSTPDHMHAIPVAAALSAGLAVYCEKPLTHSVYEARHIRKLAEESGCVTQMGNQVHNEPAGNYRRVVEIVRAGTIGPVRRVHVWMESVPHFVVGKRVAQADVPAGISYEKWLGPAPFRPFHPSHFHFNWRYWWDFGGGQLADFWCHYCDLAFWALDLENPATVHATGEKGHDGDNDCPKKMKVDFQFPARGDQPPVHLTWYHGGPMPEGAEVYSKRSAVLFEGDQGRLLADYTTRQVFMQDGTDAAPVPPSIPDSIGHHREWIEAIKAKDPNTTCNFRYGALLTEVGLLGNVSYRAGKQVLQWDHEQLRATNCAGADPFIRREYRNGWSLA